MSTITAVKSPKEISKENNNRNKINSENGGRLYNIFVCFTYLLQKGFTVVFKKEERIATKRNSNLPIEKIINPQGIVVFDHTKNYQTIILGEKSCRLAYDEEGIPLETNETLLESEKNNNDFVVMDIIREYMNRSYNMEERFGIKKTKTADNKLSSTPLNKVIFINNTNSEEIIDEKEAKRVALNEFYPLLRDNLSRKSVKYDKLLVFKGKKENSIQFYKSLFGNWSPKQGNYDKLIFNGTKETLEEIYLLSNENLSRKQGNYDGLILGSQLTPGKKDLVILIIDDYKGWSSSGQSTNSLSVPIGSFIQIQYFLMNSPISQQPIICEELPHTFNVNGSDSTTDKQETESYPLEMKEDKGVESKEVTMDEEQMDNGSLPVNLTNNGVYYDMNGQSMEFNVSHMEVDDCGQVLDHLIVQPIGGNVYSFVIDDGNGQQGYMDFDDTNNQQIDYVYFDHNSLKTSHEDDYEPEENKGFIQSK